MAIADKLTYLNATKALLREAINRAGHYLAEADPFREYPYALLKDEYSLKLDFLRGEYIAKNWRDGTVSRVGFDSIITFTRGSGGGRYNHLGVFEWVGNNVARIDHDPATVDTSTSSVTIGAGLKTFDVSRLYPIGQYVRATADASNWLSGRVVASTGSSVTLWVDRVVGTGTHASWTLIRVLGLLVEEQRTNLIGHSDDPSNSAWLKTELTASGNTITESAANAFRDLQVRSPTGAWISFTSGTAYIAVAVAKPKAGSAKRYLQMAFSSLAFPFAARMAKFDLDTCSVTWRDSVGVTATATRVGDYCVCTISVGATSTASGYGASLALSTSATGATTAYAGDGSSGIELLYADVQAGAFPTSHIPTTSAQVTRAADAPVVGNLSDWYRAGGTVFSQHNVERMLAVTNRHIWSLSDGGFNNFMAIRYRPDATNIQMIVVTVGTGQTSDNLPPSMNLGSPIAFAYSQDDFRASVGGGGVVSDSEGNVPAVTRLNVGYLASAGQYLNGHIETVEFIPRALSNTELQAITS